MGTLKSILTDDPTLMLTLEMNLARNSQLVGALSGPLQYHMKIKLHAGKTFNISRIDRKLTNWSLKHCSLCFKTPFSEIWPQIKTRY